MTGISLPNRRPAAFASEVKRGGLDPAPAEPLSGPRALLRNQTSVGRRVEVYERIGPLDQAEHRGGIFSGFGAYRRPLLRHNFSNSRCGTDIALGETLDRYLLVLVRLGLHHARIGRKERATEKV